jgi:GGDEF domain-containing protein
MRTETADLIRSLRSFLGTLCCTSQDHRDTLRKEFNTLDTTAQVGIIEPVREAIRRTEVTALRSCEEMQKAHDLITAQLQDEIRSLHREVDQERRAAVSDTVTGVWNRAKLDSRIKDLVLLNEAFCIFLVGLPSLVEVSRHDPRVAPEILKAMVGRLHALSGKNSEAGMVGRWSEEIFAIVFNLPLAGAPVTRAAVHDALSSDYTVHLHGVATNVHPEVHVQTLERAKDSPEAAFYLRLGQAAFDATAH